MLRSKVQDEPDARVVRQRCEAALRDLEVPRPFDLEALCESIARRRGRSLRIHRVERLPVACGWWMAADDGDHVFLERGTSPLHQTLIVLHELAHMVLEHRSQDSLSRLFPITGPSAAEHFLARSAFDGREEREAELLASLVLVDADWEPAATVSSATASAEAAALLGRLSRAFGAQAE